MSSFIVRSLLSLRCALPDRCASSAPKGTQTERIHSEAHRLLQRILRLQSCRYCEQPFRSHAPCFTGAAQRLPLLLHRVPMLRLHATTAPTPTNAAGSVCPHFCRSTGPEPCLTWSSFQCSCPTPGLCSGLRLLALVLPLLPAGICLDVSCLYRQCRACLCLWRVVAGGGR